MRHGQQGDSRRRRLGLDLDRVLSTRLRGLVYNRKRTNYCYVNAFCGGPRELAVINRSQEDAKCKKRAMQTTWIRPVHRRG